MRGEKGGSGAAVLPLTSHLSHSTTEREGFEPSIGVDPLCRFSKPVPSATRPPLQRAGSFAGCFSLGKPCVAWPVSIPLRRLEANDRQRLVVLSCPSQNLLGGSREVVAEPEHERLSLGELAPGGAVMVLNQGAQTSRPATKDFIHRSVECALQRAIYRKKMRVGGE